MSFFNKLFKKKPIKKEIRFERTTEASQPQFICVECKKAFDNKYLHSNKLCVNCFSKSYVPAAYEKVNINTQNHTTHIAENVPTDIKLFMCANCKKLFDIKDLAGNNMCKTCFSTPCIDNAKYENFDINEINIYEIDNILEIWQKRNNVQLSDSKINKIKSEVNAAVDFIKQNTKDITHNYFYYSEYPMGAEISKSLQKNNNEWSLVQCDYRKKPKYKEIKLTSVNFIEEFIAFEYSDED